jgi:hypothetical protein
LRLNWLNQTQLNQITNLDNYWLDSFYGSNPEQGHTTMGFIPFSWELFLFFPAYREIIISDFVFHYWNRLISQRCLFAIASQPSATQSRKTLYSFQEPNYSHVQTIPQFIKATRYTSVLMSSARSVFLQNSPSVCLYLRWRLRLGVGSIKKTTKNKKN